MSKGTDWLEILRIPATYFAFLGAAGLLILNPPAWVSQSFGLEKVSEFWCTVIGIGTIICLALAAAKFSSVCLGAVRWVWKYFCLWRSPYKVKNDELLLLICAVKRDSKYFWSHHEEPNVRELSNRGLIRPVSQNTNGINEYAVNSVVWVRVKEKYADLKTKLGLPEKELEAALFKFDRMLKNPHGATILSWHQSR